MRVSRLAQQQEALLALLFDRPPESAPKTIATHAIPAWPRGQKVYQANGHALACSALGAAYPVVAQLLGKESFGALARTLWHAHPPQCGDVGRWGNTLAAFISTASTPLADAPYLADVARLEWALHTCASAADPYPAPNPASFALLAEHDFWYLSLILAPGCAVLESAWPVVRIVESLALGDVGSLLRAGVGEEALVWRTGFKPRVRCTQPGEAAFVAALLEGQTLGGALDSLPHFDAAAWLPRAVQTGLLLGVGCLVPAARTPPDLPDLPDSPDLPCP